MKTRLALGALAGVLLVGLVGTPGGAIINGKPDGAAHPNVGLLAYDPDGEGPGDPFAICTGSVLSDRVFLTAAHCITAPFVPPGSQWVVTLEEGGPGDTVYEPGLLPEDFPFAVTAPVVRSTRAVVHGKFNPTSRKNDVAVLVFPRGTFEGVDPVLLPKVRQLSRLHARGRLEGRELTLVGYGADLALLEGQTRLSLPGFRQVGTTEFARLTRHALFLRGNKTGGLCTGDSGGPQFLRFRGAVRAVSLASRGVCEGGAGFSPGESRSQRLDKRVVHRFLGKFVELP